MAEIIALLLLGTPVAIILFMLKRREQISKRERELREHDIVECGSCQNRLTLATFRQRGGCPRCGSDIFTRTGQRAGQDNRI